MNLKIFVVLLISSLLVFTIAEFYAGYVYVEDEIQNNLIFFSNDFESKINNTLEMMKITDVPDKIQKLPNGITGLMELSPNGSPVNIYGDFKTSDYFKSTIYRFASLNGFYVSPFEETNGNAVTNLAVKADDGDITVVQITQNFRPTENASTYLVDPTGIGIEISSSGYEWKNLVSFIANPSQVFVKWPNLIFKARTYGGYSFVTFFPISKVVYMIFVHTFVFYFLFFIVAVMLTLFLYFWYKKHVKNLADFAQFVEKLDKFKKYENDGAANFEMIDNYNKLVGDNDKMYKSHADTIDELGQANSTLIKLNDLYSELPFIFERVENEDTFEDALKVISRRILDTSKTVNGVGIRYDQTTVTVGSVTSYDFQNMNSKFHAEMKTGKNKITFILNLDTLTETNLLKEMLNALLHHVAAIVSTYELKEEGKKSAKYDPLTELFTRQEFINVVTRELEKAKRDKQPISFVVIDIKHFKEFNEIYGHFEGDVLMKFIAKVINSNMRVTDVSCRWGEDEFAICFPNLKKADITAKITNVMGKIKTFKREINLKIGSSYYPQDSENIEEIMKIAESRVKIDDM